MESNVIVIGAGMAGLSTASRLYQHGFKNVQILEARDRTGGRTYTKSYGTCGFEMGAQWVHGEAGNVIYELVKANGLNETNAPDFIECVGAGFRQLKSEPNLLVASEMFNIENEIQSSESGSKLELFRSHFEAKFEDWLRRSGDAQVPFTLFDWNCRFHSHICGSDDLSLVAEPEVYQELEGNKTIELRDHYRSVVDLVQKTFPQDWLKLNAEVVEIDWNESGVTINLADGSNKTADFVVVTIPLGVLKANYKSMFKRQLPAGKVAAIENLGFGSDDKIFLVYDVPFWKEGDIFNVLWLDGKDSNGVPIVDEISLATKIDPDTLPSNWMRSLIYFTYVRHQPNVLCAWIGGPAARFMETLSDQEVSDQCHRVLCQTLNNFTLANPSEIFRSQWYLDPFTRGSYSFVTVKCAQENIGPSDLAQPLFDENETPRVLFAGEATHDCFHSAVHGAYESGVREANRLFDFCNKL